MTRWARAPSTFPQELGRRIKRKNRGTADGSGSCKGCAAVGYVCYFSGLHQHTNTCRSAGFLATSRHADACSVGVAVAAYKLLILTVNLWSRTSDEPRHLDTACQGVMGITFRVGYVAWRLVLAGGLVFCESVHVAGLYNFTA